MSCSKCKKKEEREFLEKQIDRIEKPVVIIGTVIVSLTLYGLWSLVSKIISFF